MEPHPIAIIEGFTEASKTEASNLVVGKPKKNVIKAQKLSASELAGPELPNVLDLIFTKTNTPNPTGSNLSSLACEVSQETDL